MIINGKSLTTMEAIRSCTTQGMSSIKEPVNINYFLSVKNMLEGDLKYDHITVNTTIYCVIKRQLYNWMFTMYEPKIIVSHKLSFQP